MNDKQWMRDREKARMFDETVRRAWRKVFPDVVECIPTADGSDDQRLEIDRRLVLANGRIIPVEEKVRFRPFTEDILIEVEHIHSDGRVEPGWINKRMDSEYFGYLWYPSLAFCVLPTQMLQAWWRSHSDKRDHKMILAKNDGYNTRCAIVNMHRLPCGVFEMLESDRWNNP